MILYHLEQSLSLALIPLPIDELSCQVDAPFSQIIHCSQVESKIPELPEILEPIPELAWCLEPFLCTFHPQQIK